ncbi:polysaccharide deacetylase family protein [Cryptosporangium sp. NPDC048952]|uniref:polysaccharide deacetylase family protein n=1 Tax=Cryptosporangium sp. NPDC048952 TaxID=3363961 RepID=UPI0037231F55
MTDAAIVVAVNYHRIGSIDPANPLHRLHTVSPEVFGQQLDWMQEHGQVVSPNQVRGCDGLGDLNFVVCFDDVPISALTGITEMQRRGLPLTLSPCGQLAEHGTGTRDAVYALEKFLPAEDLADHVHTQLPAPPGREASFYHLTKSDGLDPQLVRSALIEPLLARLDAPARDWLTRRGYLSWQQIAQLTDDPLVTVANHTYRHDNLAALSRGALREEIQGSHALFADRLGQAATYFTVPFGRFTQELALDCVDILADLDYRGILWVGQAGLRVHGPYRHRILHLPRLHASTTLGGFADQVRAASRTATRALIWQVPAQPHHDRVEITGHRDPRSPMRVEMVLRQGKDYASDPAFYRYQFTDNPYRGERPDFHAVEHAGRIEAIAYNFHTSFVLEGQHVPGVYLSSWRKLPHARPGAAALLLRTMLDREPVVGVYRPNPEIVAAFTGWCRARVHDLSIPVAATGSKPLPITYRTEEHSTYPEDITGLCIASARAAGFTVARDSVYHRWRHDSYPLAAVTYLALYTGRLLAAVAVVLHRPGAVAIADFHLSIEDATEPLIQAVLAFAQRRGIGTVTWETSNPHVIATAGEQFGATATPYDNFYRFHPELLAAAGVEEGIADRWAGWPLHETATTSDVLLR